MTSLGCTDIQPSSLLGTTHSPLDYFFVDQLDEMVSRVLEEGRDMRTSCSVFFV